MAVKFVCDKDALRQQTLLPILGCNDRFSNCAVAIVFPANVCRCGSESMPCKRRKNQCGVCIINKAFVFMFLYQCYVVTTNVCCSTLIPYVFVSVN